jgi:hypothetical protein
MRGRSYSMYVWDDIYVNIGIEIRKRRCQIEDVCKDDRLLLKLNLKK